MNPLILCVTYTSKPGEREAFLKEILGSGVVDIIRKEDGCLGYEYFCSAERENEILLMERWETEEKQQAHLKQPHMEQLKEIKNKYIADTRLEKI